MLNRLFEVWRASEDTVLYSLPVVEIVVLKSRQIVFSMFRYFVLSLSRFQEGMRCAPLEIDFCLLRMWRNW